MKNLKLKTQNLKLSPSLRPLCLGGEKLITIEVTAAEAAAALRMMKFYHAGTPARSLATKICKTVITAKPEKTSEIKSPSTSETLTTKRKNH